MSDLSSVNVGDLVVSTRYGILKVDRLTNTRVITSDGRRWSWKDGVLIGGMKLDFQMIRLATDADLARHKANQARAYIKSLVMTDKQAIAIADTATLYLLQGRRPMSNILDRLMRRQRFDEYEHAAKISNGILRPTLCNDAANEIKWLRTRVRELEVLLDNTNTANAILEDQRGQTIP